MALLFSAGAFFSVNSSRFPATRVSPADGAVEGLCWNDARGYLEEPKDRARQQAVG